MSNVSRFIYNTERVHTQLKGMQNSGKEKVYLYMFPKGGGYCKHHTRPTSLLVQFASNNWYVFLVSRAPDEWGSLKRFSVQFASQMSFCDKWNINEGVLLISEGLKDLQSFCMLDDRAAFQLAAVEFDLTGLFSESTIKHYFMALLEKVHTGLLFAFKTRGGTLAVFKP